MGKAAEMWASAGTGFLGQAAQTGLGILLGRGMEQHNDERQIRQQRALQDMQWQANRDMMNHSFDKQFEMWQKTNYSAQKEQMRMAGLNPGLMYGMGGGGGTTTGSGGGSVGGGDAPKGGGEAMGMGMMAGGMQLQLLQAQKANIEANTEKTKAEAEKTAGVDTAEARTRILDLTVGIDNKRARATLDNANARLAEMEGEIKGRTLEDSVRAIQWGAEKIFEDLIQARHQTYIVEETWQTKIAQVRAELLYTWAKTAAAQQGIRESKSNIQVNDAQIRKLANDIVQRGMEWETRQQGANTDQNRQQYEQFINDMQRSLGVPMDVLREAVDGIFKALPRTRTRVREGTSDRQGDYYERTTERY